MATKNNQWIALRPSYWASVSGGKDSLYMLFLIMKHPERWPLDGVVHFELENDFPFIKDVVEKMKGICEKAGVPFFAMKPSRTWEELYDRFGYPNLRKRWCNSTYKLDAEKQVKEFLLQQGKYLVSYVGLCADETKRFRFELNDRGQNVTQIYPLAEAGIVEDYIWRWARTEPIFNSYYVYNKRCGCICCPLSSYQNLAYAADFYPDIYEYYMRLAEEHEKDRAELKGVDRHDILTFRGGMTVAEIRAKVELRRPVKPIPFGDE